MTRIFQRLSVFVAIGVLSAASVVVGIAGADTAAAVANSAVSASQQANPTSVSGADENVTFSLQLTNTGTVTLTNVHPEEVDFTGSTPLGPFSCDSQSTLAPGMSRDCSITYTVTQIDADAGSFTNTVRAVGTGPGGDVKSADMPSTVTIDADPELSVVQSASPADAARFTVGQVITWSFLITNTGNVTLSDVTDVPGKSSGSGPRGLTVCDTGAASLAPAAQVTCRSDYTLTSDDVGAGFVRNTVRATGTPPQGDPQTSKSSSATIPDDPAPALTLVQTADVSAVNTAGTVINYSFRITNTGNISVTSAHVVQGVFTGTGQPPTIDCPIGAATMLPGAIVVCTASYTVLSSDSNLASISNSATATASAARTVTDPSATSMIAVTMLTAASVASAVKVIAATGAANVLQAIAAATGLTLLGLFAVTFVWLRRRRNAQHPLG